MVQRSRFGPGYSSLYVRFPSQPERRRRVQVVSAEVPHLEFLLEPASSHCERVWPQLAHPYPSGFPRHHEFAQFQHTEVLHEAGERHVMLPRKLTDARRAFRKLNDDGAPGAVRERLKYVVKVSHIVNY